MWAPDWWQELVPEGTAASSPKRISTGCPSMASQYLQMDEVTRIYRFQQREDYVHEMGRGQVHPPLDDMSTISTSDHLNEKFLALYWADFDVTRGDLIQFFLGLEVEQLDSCIKLHLDMYPGAHRRVYPADQAKIPKAEEGTNVTRACEENE